MRRDLNELASMLFPDPADVVREGLGGIMPPTYEGGVALADSEGGAVQVLPDGTVTTWADGDPDGTAEDAADPDAEAAEPVTVPCTANVREGDQVLLVVQDGAYVDCMAAGSGDRIATEVSAAATLAEQAKTIAEAIGQFAWNDSNGTHVSTEEGIAEGTRNILLNSYGILLRAAANYLAALTQSGVAFYDGNGNEASNVVASFGANGAQVGAEDGTHLLVDSDSVDIMGVVSSAVALLMSMGYDATHAMAYIFSPDKIGIQSNTGGSVYGSSAYAQAFVESTATRQDSQLEATNGTASANVSADVTSGTPSAAMNATSGSNSSAVSVTKDAVWLDTTGSVYVNNEPLVMYKDKAVTVPSTAAGANYSGSAISVLESGYIAVGCIQTWWASGTGQNKFNDYGTHVEAGNLYVRLHNYGTSAASGSLKCRILYVKTELL